MAVKWTEANYSSLSELSVDAASPGYKLTEAGVVPEDWEISTVGVEFSVQLGKMLDAEKNVGISKPFLGNRAIQWGRVDPSCIGQIKLTARDLQRYRLREGDLLVCEGGEVGRAAIWRNELDECYYQKALHRLRSKRGYNPTLMLNVLRKHAASGVLQNFVTQTSIAHLPKDKFEEVPVPLPGKIEQEAIAEALSDADALIESLEQLIAKKRQIKQGTMQALLTGKQRLPGVGGKLESKRLDQLGRWVGGMTPSMRNPSYWQGGTVPWISSGDVKLPRLKDTTQRVTAAALKDHTTTLVPENSIVVVMRSGILRKFFPVAMNMVPMAINQDLKALIPESGMCAEYILHALIGSGDEILARCLKSGTTVESIEFGWLKSFTIWVPAPEEQAAIATILTDMDTELAELETRLAKTRQLKQGMMQELLTGRIRLVQPALNVVPLPEKKETRAAAASPHNRQINEAVVIAALVKQFGSEDWPLARVRRTKLTYLLHRHAEGRADGFLKKAAGPYDPRTRYKGPEGIALKKGYVQALHNGTYEGFVASEHISEAETYFEKWYGTDVMDWLERFRLRKTDELELLTTVDMAMEDLRREGKPISVEAVRQLIHGHPEWKPKLERAIFSDDGIAAAIAECQALFAS